MNDSKILYVYRHGETDWNISSRVMGQLEGIETEFTPLGFKQITDLANKLKQDKVEVIYCSDFQRAYETATIANSNLNLPIFPCKEIRGLNMGTYQGMLFDEYINQDEVRMCFQNYDLPIGGGESINQLNNRVLGFIMSICEKSNYNKIAIISHSAVISNLKSYLTHQNYASLYECTLLFKNGNIYLINYRKNDVNKTIGIQLYNDLIFVRHAENIVDNSIENDLLPLSNLGIKQAKAVLELIENDFDIVYCSTSQRAYETACIVSRGQKKIIQDSRLLERGWGNDEKNGLETDDEARIRISNVLSDININYFDRRVLIVTHGSLMKLAQDVIEGNYCIRDSVENCNIIKYNKDKQKIILRK